MSNKESKIPVLTETERKILNLLAVTINGTELHAYELVKLSNGEIKMGSVYTLLGRLSKKNVVISRTEEQKEYSQFRPRRRYYKITDVGTRVLKAYQAYNEALTST